MPVLKLYKDKNIDCEKDLVLIEDYLIKIMNTELMSIDLSLPCQQRLHGRALLVLMLKQVFVGEALLGAQKRAYGGHWDPTWPPLKKCSMVPKWSRNSLLLGPPEIQWLRGLRDD